jgi:hypothetical protein
LDISYNRPVKQFILAIKEFNGHLDMVFRMHDSGLHYWQDPLAEHGRRKYAAVHIRDTCLAVSLKAKVGYASNKDLIWALKTGAIKICKVKPKDLENTIAIWGKGVVELKSKTVRKKLAPVVSDIMKVPRALLKLEKDVSLA